MISPNNIKDTAIDKLAVAKDKVTDFRPSKPRLSPRDKVMIVGVIVVAVALIPVGMQFLPQSKSPSKAPEKQKVLNPGPSDPATQGEPVAEDPDFKALLPENKKASDLGGWKRISPPDTNAVYAYADKIDQIAVTVSQQPVPDEFKNNQSKVAEFAKSYAATTIIQAHDSTVYIGTSTKGPQSVIFTKNNLLVLIKTSAKVEQDSLITYINSLR